jgi:hypothetical protein
MSLVFDFVTAHMMAAHITLLQQYYWEWHGVPIFEVLLNLAYIYPSQAKPTNIIYY